MRYWVIAIFLLSACTPVESRNAKLNGKMAITILNETKLNPSIQLVNSKTKLIVGSQSIESWPALGELEPKCQNCKLTVSKSFAPQGSEKLISLNDLNENPQFFILHSRLENRAVGNWVFKATQIQLEACFELDCRKIPEATLISFGNCWVFSPWRDIRASTPQIGDSQRSEYQLIVNCK